MAGSRPLILIIAGSDSSGGAGLQRDVQVATEHHMAIGSVVTAVTAQSHQQVHAIHHVPASVIREQMRSVAASGAVTAIKIGMLGCGAAISAIAEALVLFGTVPVVLDPVLVASSGRALLEPTALSRLLEELCPRVTLITPNIPEVLALTFGREADDKVLLAQQLADQVQTAVLLKGGHDVGDTATDVLVQPAGRAVLRIPGVRYATAMRGTGCALSTTIAIHLGRGATLQVACTEAKKYVAHKLSQGKSC